ncbi:MAG TPA: hypothetical protein VGW12_17950 [Pyrinomonadaceae bacterium]|nr:hypothetical protein [Pyrinomonadaceae bacterium]
MPRFAKQTNCPATIVLEAYAAGKLSFLARPAVTSHLAACEFCGAELALLAQSATVADAAPSATHEVEPPPAAMPLALRLFAESALAEMNAAIAAARVEAKRAA